MRRTGPPPGAGAFVFSRPVSVPGRSRNRGLEVQFPLRGTHDNATGRAREEAFRAIDAAFRYRHIFIPWDVYDGSAFPWSSDPRWQAYRQRLNCPPK